ncbi:MAG TPA: alpha/beta fold hydrolase [Candidatus Micrarchaeaceae archaeon]|nr:alpha/beta fold hydrolase [Candidatus Micrarchaeaceae archaeon]
MTSMNKNAPLHTPAIRTNLGRLDVYDTGAPPRPAGSTHVLVFWHSILADHHIYDAQVAALRERHRLILIDGPAHGASGAPIGGFSMAQCAQAQEQVLDALGIAQPVICIGTSWGGLVAGEFALHYPHRTRAIVMLSPPVFRSSARLRDGFVAWGARWLSGTNVYVNGVAKGYFMPGTRERETDFMARFRHHIRDIGGKALAQVVRSVLLDREDLSARLRNIVAPTLFVAGTYDTMCPIEDQRRAAAQLPHGRFIELPTAHIAVVDAPTESTRAIERFLSEL